MDIFTISILYPDHRSSIQGDCIDDVSYLWTSKFTLTSIYTFFHPLFSLHFSFALDSYKPINTSYWSFRCCIDGLRSAMVTTAPIKVFESWFIIDHVKGLDWTLFEDMKMCSYHIIHLAGGWEEKKRESVKCGRSHQDINNIWWGRCVEKSWLNQRVEAFSIITDKSSPSSSHHPTQFA